MTAQRARCVHCGGRIRYVEAPAGGAWQHIATISVYCAEDSDTRAEPRVGA